jgi:maltose alpha-D-glucosyltransferase/alpha-amylase
VNVEAQSRDPHSLLNWTRRMLATRRSKHTFGRGTIRFLKPSNRKILAYLRELPGQPPILCVANLSRAPQAVELDLSEFNGAVPIEMTADSVFPAIGQLTYLLTFPPYGFLWFLLCEGGGRPTWSQAPSEPLPDFVTIVIREGQAGPTPENVRLLESEVLPSWLGRRRWYASKDQKLHAVRLAALTTIPEAGFAFTEIEADVGNHTERYVLPLAITWGADTTTPLFMQLALARVRRGRNVGHLTDAFALPQFAYGTLRKLRERAAVATFQKSTIHFIPTDRFADLDLGDAPEIRWLAAEQSNSSLVIADKIVLKLVRRLLKGMHPEAEMSRYLTQLGYANTAPLYGEVVRVDPENVPHTLCILQGFVDNQGDAWNWALDTLRRSIDELALAVDGANNENQANQDRVNEEEATEGYASYMGIIGKRLGELHVALATPSDNPAFDPEPADAKQVQAWIDGTQKLLASALELLEKNVDQLGEDAALLGRSVLDRKDKLVEAVSKLVKPDAHALRTRIHGDFHLGQVLVAQGDAFLIDFEGEPARELEERRAKSSPLRDVAGLLRSLSYASAAAQSTMEAAPQMTADRKRALFERFRAAAAEAFLTEYRAATQAASQRLVAPEHEQALLDLFLIEKAAYEIRYEAANRPAWLGLPVRGLAALTSRLLGDTGAAPHSPAAASAPPAASEGDYE